MAGGGSPADPLFWLHHGNIDWLWAVWQRNHPGAAQYTTDPAVGDSVAAAMVPLNSPMIGGATPASMLDHRTLGYTYDTDVRLEGAWEANGRPGHLATGDATSSDFFIRDDVADTGALPSGFPHWQSPDIWVRNAPPSQTENPMTVTSRRSSISQITCTYGSTTEGRPRPALSRWRLTAASRAPACSGPPTFSRSAPAAAPGRRQRGLGPSRAFRLTPTVVGHECLLAIVRTEADDVGSLETVHGVTIPAGAAAALDHSLLVRFDNNVGQRNVAPVLAAPGASTQMGLMIRGLEAKGHHSVLIDAAELPSGTIIRARLANGVLSSGHTDIPVASRDARFTTLEMDGGRTGAIKDVEIGGNDSFVLTLGVDFSFNVTHLRRYPVRVQQTHHDAVVGSYTIELTAVKDLEDFFLGNRRSGELHVSTCQLWPRINKARLDTFERIDDAQARGYNGCRFCLAEADTG